MLEPCLIREELEQPISGPFSRLCIGRKTKPNKPQPGDQTETRAQQERKKKEAPILCTFTRYLNGWTKLTRIVNLLSCLQGEKFLFAKCSVCLPFAKGYFCACT